MAVLSKRQQVAEALKDEIHRLKGFVINPMPLADGARLRCQFLVPSETALAKIRELGFDPILVSYGLRFHSNAAVPCGTYEIYLEPERQEIPQENRVIPRDEIATREKAGYEAEQVMRYLGMGP